MKNLSFTVVALLLFVLTGCGTGPLSSSQSISPESAKIIAIDFIQEQLLPSGQAAKILNFSDTGDLYKMDVEVNGQTIPAYLTKDGKTFFPQGMDIETVKADKLAAKKLAEEEQAKKLAGTPKSEKPSVELFVMSHCPFGTQMEKGLLPVLETLGDTIDFELKFNTYAMHDKKELIEQNLQHCIKTETPDKLLPYVGCFLADENTGRCLDVIEETEETYASCLESVESEFKVMENYEDSSTWTGRFPSYDLYKADNEKYGVRGSPTLVVNGHVVSTSRDSASLLSVICSGFETTPEECSTELPSVAPTPGFGYGVSAGGGGSSDANCGV